MPTMLNMYKNAIYNHCTRPLVFRDIK